MPGSSCLLCAYAQVPGVVRWLEVVTRLASSSIHAIDYKAERFLLVASST